MHSLPVIEGAAPPRLLRAVALQLAAIAALTLIAALPWRRPGSPPPAPAPEPKREERRIRIVQLSRPAPPPAEARPPPPASAAPTLKREAPAPARRAERPAPASGPPKPELAPRARIAADSTAIHGVRMRVLVPRSPGELASHLRNSGGCLVVSRLSGGSAEVLSVLGVQGGSAVELSAPPCDGVPRLLHDSGLNAALGDPLGRARAASPGDDLVLQVLLSPLLHETARLALRSRFGSVSEEEMGRRAAESGYELTCFAEPAGSLRCE